MSSDKAYAAAGVDIDAASQTKSRISKMVSGTFGPEVLTDIGGFGGLFAPNWQTYENPVLVASTDGVGTKLKIAFLTGIHNTIGADLVAHCANDILVQGAKPIFFMDYLAMGSHDSEVATAVIEGVANGCKASGCALLGGEMAEMPGLYAKGEYDLAGTIVGMVDKDRILDGSSIEAGNCLIGIPSSGLHTNGFSLARQILFETAGLTVDSQVDELRSTIGEALLTPHLSYVDQIHTLMEEVPIKGLAHITGGGLIDNVPRTLPAGLGAQISSANWPQLPIFSFLSNIADEIDRSELFQVFNMGIGMVAIVHQDCVGEAIEILESGGKRAYIIGEIVEDMDQKVNIT